MSIEPELAERLARERPVPRAAFRSALHQRLVALERSSPSNDRPADLWRRIAALAASGTALLALVALGVAGTGPFSR
jgi:hypothetical protein